MCGIAGIFGRTDAAAVARMCVAMRHRGPDAGAQLDDPDGGFSLGHVRLAILDLSANGNQPMTSADGRCTISYNGEVYNYRELRAELESHGHAFRSQTDTEVVLAAYRRWGANCLPKLRGMFAFAIVDRQRPAPRLFLARDRFGIKPLYYAWHEDALYFASELRALLAAKAITGALDPIALAEYLAYGSVLQPETIFRNAHSMPPATYALLEQPRPPSFHTYWQLAPPHASPPSSRASFASSVDRLRACLDQATTLHLAADVPVAAFLSGGIDSGAVVSLMSRHRTNPVKAFTVAFESKRQAPSEFELARLTAANCGAEALLETVTGGEVARNFDQVIAAFDQPSHDGVNSFFVARAARREATVCLSGLGGDELFAGYSHFRWFRQAARLAWLPRPLLAMAPARLWPGQAFHRQSCAGRLAALRRLQAPPEVNAILAPEWHDPAAEQRMTEYFAALVRPDLDPVTQVSVAETRAYLSNTLLRDVDALSMHHSLEVRPVLLDHELAELAISLPPEHLLHGRQGKLALREAVRDLLPPAVLVAPKRGFDMPVDEWLAGPLRQTALDALASRATRTLFQAQFVESLSARIRDGGNLGIRDWSLVVLAAWNCLHQTRVAP